MVQGVEEGEEEGGGEGEGGGGGTKCWIIIWRAAKSDYYHVAFGSWFPDIFSSGVDLNVTVLLPNLFCLYYSGGIFRLWVFYLKKKIQYQ